MLFKKSLFKPSPLGVRSLYLAYTLYNHAPTRRCDSVYFKLICCMFMTSLCYNKGRDQ